jgi:hypothetical protein
MCSFARICPSTSRPGYHREIPNETTDEARWQSIVHIFSPSFVPTSPGMLITSPTSLPTSSALSASSPFFGPASPAYPPSAPRFSPTSLQYVGPSDSLTASRREQPRYSPPNPVYSSTQQFSTPWPDYSPTSPTFSTTATQFNAPPEDLSGTTGSYRPLLAVFDGTVWHFQHPGGLPVNEPLRNISKRARFVRLYRS